MRITINVLLIPAVLLNPKITFILHRQLFSRKKIVNFIITNKEVI